jgi:hypothetical protein
MGVDWGVELDGKLTEVARQIDGNWAVVGSRTAAVEEVE